MNGKNTGGLAADLGQSAFFPGKNTGEKPGRRQASIFVGPLNLALGGKGLDFSELHNFQQSFLREF
jgi:hypothetical protein